VRDCLINPSLLTTSCLCLVRLFPSVNPTHSFALCLWPSPIYDKYGEAGLKGMGGMGGGGPQQGDFTNPFDLFETFFGGGMGGGGGGQRQRQNRPQQVPCLTAPFWGISSVN
jgi:hypothetical protein